MGIIQKALIWTCGFLMLNAGLFSAEADPNKDISKVYLVFKTHLDIGFTDLSSKVEQRYINEFIPKAIAAAEQLRTENASERYVWTTGSWLIHEYLRRASPDEARKLADAIGRGDIVWNALPYTVESEAMSRDLFETSLGLSRKLDERFGKKTIAGKMTDVPGHTRGIVTSLSDAGIVFLHIGANPAVAVPDIPPLCRWRNTDGKEIILMYQTDYGKDMILPAGKIAVSINFTGDNHGPHSISQIKNIYASIKKKYPNAAVEAVSLNEVARELQAMKNKLPVITSEIGDTWIYGIASSPLRISQFRALSRLYTNWLTTGKLNQSDPAAIDFAITLGLVPEHTWGVDVKTHLGNWDKYDVDIFNQSRGLPAFKFAEQSWAEQDAYLNKAIEFLPKPLQREARKELDDVTTVELPDANYSDVSPEINQHGAYEISSHGMRMLAGELTYQAFSAEDFKKFQDRYLRHKYGWAIADLGKPGLENTKAKSATMVADTDGCSVIKKAGNTIIRCRLKFSENAAIDSRVLPESMGIEYVIPSSGNHIEMTVSIRNKPANRLPEAYYLSFQPTDLQAIIAEKFNSRINIMDVVPGGNRSMHAISSYIDLLTKKGSFRITSLDAPVVCIGKKDALNYTRELPDVGEGIHFCLYNNLWGTNYSMWFEGSVKYRFKIDPLPHDETSDE